MQALRNASALSLNRDVALEARHGPMERRKPLPQRVGMHFTLTLALLAVGCTHTQLRWSTVKQADTLSDIYQQQVMDNLAMFVHDYNALPYFAFPSSGAATIDDRGGIGVGSLNAFRISTGANVSRGVQQSWQLSPVTDPHKLALMRCAYQAAVRNCGEGLVSTGCPSCDKRFEAFNGHGHTGDDEKCLESSCWLCVGCKRDVPKCCTCNYVGHYCGGIRLGAARTRTRRARQVDDGNSRLCRSRAGTTSNQGGRVLPERKGRTCHTRLSVNSRHNQCFDQRTHRSGIKAALRKSNESARKSDVANPR